MTETLAGDSKSGARQNRERSAFAAALTAVALWSTVATGFKLGLEQLAPEQLLLIGTVISWLLFAVVAVVRRQLRVQRSEWIVVIALGLINPFLYYLVLFEAYARLPAQIAQPLNYTWAITLALLAVPVLKQRLPPRALAGIAVSYAGVVILLDPTGGGPDLDPLGIVLALASTVLWAGYWLVNARSKSDPLAVMFASFSVALLPVAVVCAAGPGLPDLNVRNLGFGAWVGLIEMGVTFLLWQRALRLTRQAARIGQLIFLSPFASLILISVVLGEHISLTSISGLTVIVLGIWLAREREAAQPR